MAEENVKSWIAEDDISRIAEDGILRNTEDDITRVSKDDRSEDVCSEVHTFSERVEQDGANLARFRFTIPTQLSSGTRDIASQVE